MKQPQCGRSTAAFLFLMIRGERGVGKPLTALARSDTAAQLAARILQRSECGAGFPDSLLSLSFAGFDDDQRPLLHRLRQVETGQEGLPVPGRLFGEPFKGGPPQMPRRSIPNAG